MKTNKKSIRLVVSLFSMFIVVTTLFGILFFNNHIAFAQGGILSASKSDEVEVRIKYLFNDGSVYKDEKIKAQKEQILDNGDIPMLPDDMRFIDEFLYYKVKGDGNDEITRKVEEVETKDKSTQTTDGQEANKEELSKTDKETQTDSPSGDITKSTQEYKALQDKVEKALKELQDKDKISEEQKDKISDLEEKIKYLKKKIKKTKEEVEKNKDDKEHLKSIEELDKNIKLLEEKLGKDPSYHTDEKVKTSLQKDVENSVPLAPLSRNIRDVGPVQNAPKPVLQSSQSVSQSPVNKSDKKEEPKEEEIRLPNKLTPKEPSNSNQSKETTGEASRDVGTNKGVATPPSKARGTVTENKDNANQDYKIHHSDGKDDKTADKYSADARQFVSFKTKNGKVFHLIINHDEKSENVMLLTEVSEDDLLNMVGTKEKPVEKVEKIEEVKDKEPVKKQEPKKSSGAFLIILGLIVAAVIGLGYYFKIYKNKQEDEIDEEDYDEFEDDFEDEDETESVDTSFENIDEIAVDSYDDEDEEDDDE